MEKLREYIIPVKGLDIGNHQFQLEIDDAFFEQMHFHELKKGTLLLQLFIEKESALMVFHFVFSGTVKLQCDRCLERYNQELKGNFKLIFKNSDHFEEVSDEVINIPADESIIDISQYIFEFINLMIPIKKVHPDDKYGNSTCNTQMLNKLEEYSIKKTYALRDSLKKIEID